MFNMDNIVSCDVLASFSAIKIILLLLNCHLEVLRLFGVLQLNPLVIIVTANIQVNKPKKFYLHAKHLVELYNKGTTLRILLLVC